MWKGPLGIGKGIMTQSSERQWFAIEPRAFVDDGTRDGIVTLASPPQYPGTKGTCDFHVKQKIIISANGLPELELEVKRVLNNSQLEVGPVGAIHLREDLRLYTQAAGAQIEAHKQSRPSIDEKTHQRAVYEEEPIMARRTIGVDKLGNLYGPDNPMPIQRLDYASVFPLIEASGLLNGVTFDSICAFPVGDGTVVLQYSQNGMAVKRVPIEYTDSKNWCISAQDLEYLLQEDGDYILQQDGLKILL